MSVSVSVNGVYGKPKIELARALIGGGDQDDASVYFKKQKSLAIAGAITCAHQSPTSRILPAGQSGLVTLFAKQTKRGGGFYGRGGGGDKSVTNAKRVCVRGRAREGERGRERAGEGRRGREGEGKVT